MCFFPLLSCTLHALYFLRCLYEFVHGQHFLALLFTYSTTAMKIQEQDSLDGVRWWQSGVFRHTINDIDTCIEKGRMFLVSVCLDFEMHLAQAAEKSGIAMQFFFFSPMISQFFLSHFPTVYTTVLVWSGTAFRFRLKGFGDLLQVYGKGMGWDTGMDWMGLARKEFGLERIWQKWKGRGQEHRNCISALA